MKIFHFNSCVFKAWLNNKLSTRNKYCLTLLFSILIISPVSWAKQNGMDWLGNSIGKESIVLPGFSPIEVNDQNIILGAGRKYRWENSYLPVGMTSRDDVFVTGGYLNVVVDGKSCFPKPDRISFLEKFNDHVVIQAEGVIGDGLRMSVTTRVEYDGIAMVEVRLIPLRAVVISRLHFVANIRSNPWTKMLVFNAKDIDRRDNPIVRDTNYNGEFLNAISIVDGEKSFWLFQDNAEGWLAPVDDMMAVSTQNGSVEIRQKLIEGKNIIVKEKIFRFNLMVTPVKDGSGNIRQNRVARGNDVSEAKYNGLNLWWINAFAHQVFPYVEYPSEIANNITKIDKDAYPGLKQNKKILLDYRRHGIEMLPYFSAHVLNHLDPGYQQFKNSWEVHPRIVWDRLKYDAPFSAMRNDAFLTHRATGYSDYLLYRFSELIDQLGMEGLYFDQGGTRLSSNPLNGKWIDANGKIQGSTDILALREFHKRLATLFYTKGKKGIIVSHNSNAAILPAYSFVTTMLQGEEFNEKLIDYDYIKSTSLDEVRSRLGSSAFGVPTLWLEVIFAEDGRLDRSKRPYQMSKSDWHASKYYTDAYKNFMTLALLHDLPTWAYAELKIRNEIMMIVDWVSPETAKFVGYWNYSPSMFVNDVFHSHYRSQDGTKYLVILANLGHKDQALYLDQLESVLDTEAVGHKCNWSIDPIWKGDKGIKNIPVKARRFELLPLNCQ